MSAFSEQVWRLRAAADTYEMHDRAPMTITLMRNAADTIENLRNRLTETCHNAAPEYLDFLCSECGFVHYHSDANDDGEGNDWKYCPSCGRRVVR